MYNCDQCEKELDLSNHEGHVLCATCNDPPESKEAIPLPELRQRLFGLIDEYARRNLTPHYQTEGKRPESLGTMISQCFEWRGDFILLTAAEAMEDANFHDDAATLRQMAAE
jgi:hypothetical protein